MKLQFDSQQDYQLQAVASVVNIFEGQPLAKGDFEISFAAEGSSLALSEKGIGNQLVLSEEQLLANVQKIQTKNGIKVSEKLESLFPKPLPLTPNFTIEMETGTGKTYTFLRTMYELNKMYGFKKFVIVVPSVAIREGTIKNLQITHEHFQALYDHPPINYVMYDRNNLTALRNFATSNAMQVLVINIDSFTKDNNVINQKRDGTQGEKLIDYLKNTQPIVIIDEPQNFETDVRRQAIANLNPLCTLRYSATHKNLYNLVYSLNPVQAYDLGLVKQIEVDGITSEANYNAAFIQLKKIELGKTKLKAKLSIFVNEGETVRQKELTVNVGEDLFHLSNKRDIYKDGFALNEIRAGDNEIEFANGTVIKVGETQGGLTGEIMQFQIEKAVKHHLKKVALLYPKGIKVLSLFFIDKVANYREYDQEGNFRQGKFAVWFEEILSKELAKISAGQSYRMYNGDTYTEVPITEEVFAYLKSFDKTQVHNGYFSADKASKGKKAVWIDSKEKNTQKDDDTYSLIMKDKEKLLSLDEPLQFIFSHSALREGWDNPNVFQICTLNESKSEMRKRQEIGRGLRLPVDSTGQRIHNKQINILTVIANESYETFSAELQKEIETETSVKFGNRIGNANEKKHILQFNKELSQENCPLFFEIWDRINHQTRYSVEFSQKALIDDAVKAIQAMPATIRPKLESKVTRLNYTKEGIEGTTTDASSKRTETVSYQIPDVYGYIQSKIDVSRTTIYQILIQSDKLAELEINPQMFLDNVITCIKNTLQSLLVDGVKYEEINGKKYEMALFEGKELAYHLANLVKVSKPEKTVFDYVPYDSSVESTFVKDCETDENIKFFFKLPRSFKIPTPIGNYNPDWAVILEEEGKDKIYFVAETKSNLSDDALRGTEKMKIACGDKHFALFAPLGVKYQKVVKVADLY